MGWRSGRHLVERRFAQQYSSASGPAGHVRKGLLALRQRHTQAYRQFGNSVVVPVVERIAKAVVECLGRPVDCAPDLVLAVEESRDARRVSGSENTASSKKIRRRMRAA